MCPPPPALVGRGVTSARGRRRGRERPCRRPLDVVAGSAPAADVPRSSRLAPAAVSALVHALRGLAAELRQVVVEPHPVDPLLVADVRPGLAIERIDE